MEHPAVLEMRGIGKEIGGVKALDNVNLTVRSGTVHALMGENGAGKSTLMKCLFGIYHKDAGTITLDGKEVNFRSSQEALETGVAERHAALCDGMEHAGLEQERRALVSCPADMAWHWPQADQLVIGFSLPAGHYATSVLDEILQTTEPDRHGEEGEAPAAATASSATGA